MSLPSFPTLDTARLAATRDALHQSSRVLGDLLKVCRTKRKHWWHASLRPSLIGLTTGIVPAGVPFELELDFRGSALELRAANGIREREELKGQSAQDLKKCVQRFLGRLELESELLSEFDAKEASATQHPDYAPEEAQRIQRAIATVGALMSELRAEVREETSPIQLWPHHFDLSMLWLPGSRVPDEDPANAEDSDQQLNFGFTLGDDSIEDPYFYVTAYPVPDALPETPLPEGTTWKSDGFTGALLDYGDLLENDDPRTYLLDMWRTMLAAGRELMLESRE